MNAKRKETTEMYEAYDLEALHEELTKKHNGNYSIIEESQKKEYRFPFFWKTKYLMKIEVEDQIQKKETEQAKKTILESLRLEKESHKVTRTFEKEKDIRSYLIEQEIKEEIIDKMIAQIKKSTTEQLTEQQLIDELKEKIQRLLEKRQAQMLDGVCLFFGVTGIGKTTTVVKIAKKLEKYKKVGIITTDNYKMGAYNQIEQYAKKLSIPLKTSKVDELDFPINAMKYGEGKDVVLIDTAGRSPKHLEMKDEIENYIEEINPDRTILVLAANQKYKDLLHTIEVFKKTGITDFIITKTDETNTYGFMINIAEKFDCNILYITDGQEVPNDIKEMNGAYWAEQVFGDYKK